MGCGSSTSVSPPASTARDKDVVPSPEDNHDDRSRVRTRENTPEEQVKQKLKDLEEDKKERERDKQEQDEKLQKRIEEEKRERQENKPKGDENKENEKPEQSKTENEKSNKTESNQLKQKNDSNQKIEGQGEQDEKERLKLEEEERQKREDEERQKREDEERQKREDEERQKREDEERQKREDDERQKREDEERNQHKIVEEEEDKLRSEKDETDSSGLRYQAAYNGLNVHRVDCRDQPEPPTPTCSPQTGTDLYTDHNFTLADALQQHGSGLDWKRPQEFSESPVLFSEGTTRFDIGQGSAGTCWFLSLVASISERKDIMKQIFPEDAYPVPGSADYRGVFHCRFWRFGVWEDVYIDDFLPVIYETMPWGAKSATDPNEMWVALLEKAFAKFHGSYLDVYGGQTVDAFLTLTGGVGERVTLDKANPQQLFQRLRNALCSRAMVTCTVPAEKNGINGLVGAHAYSLTGVTVVNARGEKVPLVRIRNPWGKVEWTGPWSDGSPEWQTVKKGEADTEVKDDGEFWMSLLDFFEYFSQASICSVTPDFDMDGRKDELEYLTEICGEWKGQTAAGYKNLMANPRFLISVPKAGAQDNGVVPLVIQVVQRMENRKDDKLSFRCDMFQVLGEGSSCDKKSYVYEKLGDGDNTYYTDRQHSFRHAVSPGKYMIVPSAFKEGQESDFMIRVFSPCKLEGCEKVDESALSMSCDMEEKLGDRELKHCQCMFGRWERGQNSGGQISHDTHHTNPQITFSVDKDETAVVVNVMQEASLPKLPLGVKVYKLPPGAPVPVTQDYLLEHYEDVPTTVDGEQGKFVISWDVNAPYVLQKGDYLCIFFTDQPDDSKDLAVVVKSSEKLDIKQFQMS